MPDSTGNVLSPRTARRAAVLGSPIGHSLSPPLHRAAYRALGLSGWTYERFAVGGFGEPSLPAFMAGLDEAWVGLSLTMPLKEAALRVAARVSDEARLVQSANTLIRHPDGWHAATTDSQGLVTALRRSGFGRVEDALVLGSGATARSVLQALAVLGCRRVRVAVRGAIRPEAVTAAVALGVALEVCAMGEVPLLAGQSGLVVSTLPGGTDPGWPPTAGDRLSRTVLLDVGYDPWPTPLARWASAGGARVHSGLGMLVFQAAEQVRLMTGRDAPEAAMAAAVGLASW